MTDDVLHATLFDGTLAGTHVSISVSTSPGHDLKVSGSDFGAALRAVFGASEYEYYLTIGPRTKRSCDESLMAETKTYATTKKDKVTRNCCNCWWRAWWTRDHLFGAKELVR